MELNKKKRMITSKIQNCFPNVHNEPGIGIHECQSKKLYFSSDFGEFLLLQMADH